jgi:hypothetical protein
LTLLGRYAPAEQLLLDSFEILKAELTVPARHRELHRKHIIQLYEALGKADKAAEWRSKE